MQLVLGKESQPVDAILLIFTKLCVDLDWDDILFYFTSVQKLSQEFSFGFTTLQEIV